MTQQGFADSRRSPSSQPRTCSPLCRPNSGMRTLTSSGTDHLANRPPLSHLLAGIALAPTIHWMRGEAAAAHRPAEGLQVRGADSDPTARSVGPADQVRV